MLEEVKGIGPSSASKLRASGISNVEDLATLDLRNGGVQGLSKDHLDHLRANARKVLEAQQTPELTLVDGIGPATATKLEAVGVASIEKLAGIDLRVDDVPGLSTRRLQRLKREARRLVASVNGQG